MANIRLSHPLYLDVQMMVSFLAYLEGGVFVSAEETTQKDKSREGKASGSGKMKLPSLGALLGLEASVNAEASGKHNESAEIKVARHHTAASLFNGLYQHLTDSDLIRSVERVEDLSTLTAGDFVEISGRYTGNPLEETLELMSRVLEYMKKIAEREEERSRSSASARRSGNPQTREASSPFEATNDYAQVAAQYREFEQSFELMMMLKMQEEIASSPIHDVVLHTKSELRAILTVSSEYYSQSVGERLTSGDFTTLGKVTRVLAPDESINLSRRTVIGKFGDAGDEVARSITEAIPQIAQATGSPVVGYPALQILPMAIFV